MDKTIQMLRRESEASAARMTQAELRELLSRIEPVHVRETPAEAVRAVRESK